MSNHRAARAFVLSLAFLSVANLTLQAQQVARARQAPPPTAADVAARAEVEALNKAMTVAFNRGDMKAVSAHYADHAVIRSGGWLDARGRTQVDAYFADLSAPKSWALEVRDVVDNGDGLVFQTGVSTLVHGNPERTSRVAFSLVWQRQPDRTLRIVLDYYHLAER